MLIINRLLWVWAGITLLTAAVALLRRGQGVKLLIFLWFILTLGGAYFEWNDHRNTTALPAALGQSASGLEEAPVHMEGIVSSTVERDGDRVDFVMVIHDAALLSVEGAVNDEEDTGSTEAGSEEAGGAAAAAQGEKIAVQVKLQAEEEISEAAKWKRGDRVRVDGALELPATARNFDGFDYREYLRSRHIHWLLKASGTASVTVEAPAGFGFRSVLRWSDSVRSGIGGELERLFPARDAGYLKGLIIGMQDELDPDTYKQFSRLGLTHILAISGMHVAVYAGVLLYVLTRIRLTRETALTLTMLFLPVYVLLAGAGPSVIRAGLMSMIALYAARVGILKDGLHVLCLAGWLMLLWEPYYLLNVSFQLSFLVTAGLIVFVPLAAPLLARLPRRPGSAVAVTLTAQLVSFPLTIYYFNQFAMLSFAANFILVPFITFGVLPLGTASLLLSRLWPYLAEQIAWLVRLLNTATFAVVDGIGRYAGMTIWRSPSLIWIVVYYGLLYALLLMLKLAAEARKVPGYIAGETVPLEGDGHCDARDSSPSPAGIMGTAAVRRYRITAVLITAGLSLLLYWGYKPEMPSPEGEVSFLDVGQGDSILISAPGGVHILVDGGGTLSFGSKEEWRVRRSPYEVGAKTVVPLLRKRGVHHLDAVILTHGDQDHMGGLQAVLEEIPVNALLFNGTLAEHDNYTKLMSTAVQKGIRLYAVHQGMQWSPSGSEGTRLSFLWPKLGSAGEPVLPVVEEQNNSSVVFRLEMSGRSFLFTGDIEKAAETEVIAAQQSACIPAGTACAQTAAGQVDVLKAAHHGSKTSSSEAWLQYWKPSTAVISVGENNTYGHPGKEVLERYLAAGMDIFRTDEQGEVQIKVKDGSLSVRHKLISADTSP
ncbi:ComEC/Rec2 family competence protein [Paenibacillus sinensis]|uniref:ComEC/Rec2 family competence protein n=1 Tax=Paenibacillus sinensis TaxID=2834413 RepID=UPI001F48E62A|nr:ComEC/Rec2 family competence protein [Paenibacillus sinensis]